MHACIHTYIHANISKHICIHSYIPKHLRAYMHTEIFEQRGISWNRCYSKRFGKMTDFLASCKDHFAVSSKGHVTIAAAARWHDETCAPDDPVAAKGGSNTSRAAADEDAPSSRGTSAAAQWKQHSHDAQPEDGALGLGDGTGMPGEWHDLNDSNVMRITTRELLKQYEGTESAYMLFYRQKHYGSFAEGPQSRVPPEVPQHLVAEVSAYTEHVNKQRDRYANLSNLFNAEVFLETAFERAPEHGALRSAHAKAFMCVEGDRREPVQQFRQRVCQHLLSASTGLSPQLVEMLSNPACVCLEQLQPREAGLHVFPIFPSEDSAPIGPKMPNKCQLLAYNGKSVCGRPIKSGAPYSPLLLRVIFLPLAADKDYFCDGQPVVFTASTTMQHVRSQLAKRMGLEAGQDVDLHSMEKESSEDPEKPMRIVPDNEVAEISKVAGVFDGMTITAEPWGTVASVSCARVHGHTNVGTPLAWDAFAWRNGRTRLVVLRGDSHKPGDAGAGTPPTIDVDKWDTMADVKKHAMAALSHTAAADKLRIRIGQPNWDGAAGEGFAVTDETLTVADMQLDQRSVVVLELVPQQQMPEEYLEVLLRFHVHERSCDGDSKEAMSERGEIVLNRLVNVATAKERMLEALGITDPASMWQLRRTNWAEELVEVLNDRCCLQLHTCKRSKETHTRRILSCLFTCSERTNSWPISAAF
jgi:hypothetical protein